MAQPSPYSVHPGVLMDDLLDFALKDTPVTGRLIDTGGFAKKDRITHRIAMESCADIDGEVRHWLKVAYAMDA